MKESILRIKSRDFALDIIKLSNAIKGQSVLLNQLLRSGTSIGANIYEASFAHGKKDFIAKLQIALKETYETEYWLDILLSSNIITEDYRKLLDKCVEIKKLLIASCNTAKTKQ